MCFLRFNNICLKHFLFQEELTVYYDNCKYSFYGIPDIFVRFQRKLVFRHRFLGNNQILNFTKISSVEYELLQSERQKLRRKYIQFVFLATCLKSRLGILVSFIIFCMNLLTFTFN